jgi:secreted trypsin-like serine protease
MKHYLIIATFLVSAATLHARIDDGFEAKANAFPSVIKINHYKMEKLFNLNKGHCTGTLIAPNIVLTAAHCVSQEKFVTHRVSISGDEKGNARKGSLFKDGGIRVKNIYASTAFNTQRQQQEAVENYLRSPEFLAMSSQRQEEILKKYFYLTAMTSATDLAFMILEQAQTIASTKLSQLACDNLKNDTAVTIAGYGVKKGAAGRNANPDYVLNFGHNKISDNDGLYFLEKIPRSQLANSGDSGGPLFRRKNSSKVYGVTSVAIMDGNKETLGNIYASTSSASALNFYREVLGHKSAPAALKEIVRRCLR